MSRKYDAIDRRILNELQQNGRISIVELSERVNLTKTPCSERVKRLERSGIISRYSAIINPVKVGMNHLTVVQIVLKQSSDNALNEFNEAVKSIPEVQDCLLIAGNFDYMLKVRTYDIAHFREVLGEKIGKLPGVLQTHSFSVMEVVQESDYIDMVHID